MADPALAFLLVLLAPAMVSISIAWWMPAQKAARSGAPLAGASRNRVGQGLRP
jgi:hypothetical protein